MISQMFSILYLSLFISKTCKCFLQMTGNRIMHTGKNIILLKMIHEAFTIIRYYYKQMIY